MKYFMIHLKKWTVSMNVKPPEISLICIQINRTKPMSTYMRKSQGVKKKCHELCVC